MISFVIWTVLLFVLLLTPGSGKHKMYFVPWEDKIVHAGLFAVWIALLYAPLLLIEKTKWMNLLLILLTGLIMAAGSEWLQSYIPNRSTDLYDFLADLFGTFFAVIAVLSVKKQLIIIDKKYE